MSSHVRTQVSMFRFAIRASGLLGSPLRAPILQTATHVALGVALALATRAASWGVTVSNLPRVADPKLDSALARTWRGVVATNIDPYTTGMVHRPHSETPGDAVSEGQAYGMILALYAGDQTRFNSIWDGAEKHLWNADAGFYDWRWHKGAITGSGMATDADQDIALMLLFADSLVQKKLWKPFTSIKGASYKARALELMNTLWDKSVTGKFNFAPGAGWGGDGFVNPGYFSPASYRIFAQYDKAHDWNAVVDQCYAVLARNPGAGLGMVPDWMVPDGSYFDGNLGYNAYRAGRTLYKDAIRVHWRLAMDWLWFGDARAKKFLDSAAAFVGSPDRANFYDLEGVIAPATDTFRLGDGQLRSRREYSALTVGMWACAAFSSKGADSSRVWADSLLAFLPEGAMSWGRPADLDLPDRSGSLPNEAYFEQFLGWFGAAVLAGRFSNVLDDLDDPNPTLPLAWNTLPTASPVDLDLQEGPLAVRAVLNKSASWNLTIESYPAGSVWSTSGRSDTVKASWNGFDAEGQPFPQGWCQVTTTIRGLQPIQQWVWLGHHRDIRIASDWLIVDDFTSTTLAPNLGSWGTFNNSSNGGTAKLGPLLPQGTGADRSLTYTYDLGTGGYQFCGLAWNSNNWAGFGASTKVRYRAKADHRTVMDLYLVQSDIGDDNYFHVLDTITTSWKTFEHTFASFKGRLANRSGNADPSKASALRWHVQADKCLDAGNCTKGSITLDDVHLGGNLSNMIQAPAARLAMPSETPFVGVSSRERRESTLRLRRSGRDMVELSAPVGTRVVWTTLAGRELGRSVADAHGHVRWIVPVHAGGVVFARPLQSGRSLAVVLR